MCLLSERVQNPAPDQFAVCTMYNHSGVPISAIFESEKVAALLKENSTANVAIGATTSPVDNLSMWLVDSEGTYISGTSILVARFPCPERCFDCIESFSKWPYTGTVAVKNKFCRDHVRELLTKDGVVVHFLSDLSNIAMYEADLDVPAGTITRHYSGNAKVYKPR